jgi:hypothetical protein
MTEGKNNQQTEVRFLDPDKSEQALTKVIAAAFSQGTPPANQKEFDGLQRVARESVASNKSLLETVVGFVKVILQNRLPVEVQESIPLDQMCATIGATLCNDPVARERLLRLQQQVLG